MPYFLPIVKEGVEMEERAIVDNAKVMAKGQITIPKEIRDALKMSTGARVTMVYENGRVILLNSALYAMQMLQRDMAGEAERSGMLSDEDVQKAVDEARKEIEGL